METSKLRAFVIGPIGDRDAKDGSSPRSSYEGAIEVFEYVIAPACAGLDIEAYRADHISRTGEINEQIFRNLRDEHIVIADLTNANPNVMYELGLRHTTGKLTIQIGEKGHLPFDVSTIRTILFNRTEAGFISAKRSLITVLAEGLERGSDPVTATRIWFEVSGTQGVISTSDVDGQGAVEEGAPGFLEQLADMESGMADMIQTTERGSAILEEITRIAESGTNRINNLPATTNYSASKLAAVNQVAQELHDPSIRLNIVAKDFKDHVERTTPGIEYLLRDAARHPGQLIEARGFLDAVYGLISVSERNAVSSEGFAKSVEQSGTSTRLMRRVTDSIRGSALSMAQTSRKIAAWKDLADRIEVIS
jgi:hypothetical protein